MPKMKTKRSAAKRFRFTAKGKVRFKHANLRHCLEQKQKTTKKKNMKPGHMADCDVPRVRRMLPYG